MTMARSPQSGGALKSLIDGGDDFPMFEGQFGAPGSFGTPGRFWSVADATWHQAWAAFEMRPPATGGDLAPFELRHGAPHPSEHPGDASAFPVAVNLDHIESGPAVGTAALTIPPQTGDLTFVLNNIGGVTTGSQAEAGFQRAAQLWQGFLGDSVTIRLDVGFSGLGPNILGSTGSNTKLVSYTQVRNALTADKTSADDNIAVASLPATSSLSFYTNNSAGTRVFDNDGSGNNTYLDVNTANLKALGITTDANGNAVDTGAADGSITFSSNFTWDFDPTNGITAGAIDFVGVAFHEIGHALGFTSGVDIVDYYSGSGPGSPLNLNPYAIFNTLDLFRYSANGVRELSYGGTSYFSINGGATNLALFSTGDFQGDGNQASHWKDNQGIGIMDPTSVPAGQANVITARDIQAMDVIGWNLVSQMVAGSISINDVSIAEGNSGTKQLTFTVTRTGGTAALDVALATSNWSAGTTDNDFQAKAGVLSFGAGVNTMTFSVTINGDTKYEGDEIFYVVLTGTSNGAIITDNIGIGAILNDDTATAGSVSINDVSATEGHSGTKQLTFTVTRTGGTAAFDVALATSNWSAGTTDNDFQAKAGVLSFGAGVNTMTFSVTINGDTKYEGDEIFYVVLTGASNGATITDNMGIGTILNDDTATAGSISINDVSITEGNSGTKQLTFTVTRTGGTATFDVALATSNWSAGTTDSDFQANSGILHFDAGINAATFSVMINGDTKYEGDEIFYVVLTGASNGATITDNLGIGTIVNDDAATAGSVSINDVSITEGNSGTKQLTFAVTRTGGSSPFDVALATSNWSAGTTDNDFQAKAGVLSFGAGVNTMTFSVAINGDTKVEGNELFYVVLTGASGGATIIDNIGAGTIINDDGFGMEAFAGFGLPSQLDPFHGYLL
jgi:hypothetical protein